jgi:hypothetical protein
MAKEFLALLLYEPRRRRRLKPVAWACIAAVSGLRSLSKSALVTPPYSTLSAFASGSRYRTAPSSSTCQRAQWGRPRRVNANETIHRAGPICSTSQGRAAGCSSCRAANLLRRISSTGFPAMAPFPSLTPCCFTVSIRRVSGASAGISHRIVRSSLRPCCGNSASAAFVAECGRDVPRSPTASMIQSSCEPNRKGSVSSWKL